MVRVVAMGLAGLLAAWVMPALPGAAAPAGGAASRLLLVTTTSVQDSGLLDALLPGFSARTGIRVDVVAVGTGQALAQARRGDADALLVHAPEQEKAFVEEGYGVMRRCVAYNRFVVAGPPDDPAQVRQATGAVEAFRRIAGREAAFVSRADGSGTDLKEKALWKVAGLNPSAQPWYIPSGAGMAVALTMADQRGAYILSDLATYLAMRSRLRLQLLFDRDDPVLFNQYAVMAVNPARFPHVNAAGARALIDYLLEPEVQGQIGEFGRDRFPDYSLFTPLGGNCVL